MKAVSCSTSWKMWSLWEQLNPQLNAPPFIPDERVLKAIILHDLYKAYRTYELMSSDLWEVRHGTTRRIC